MTGARNRPSEKERPEGAAAQSGRKNDCLGEGISGNHVRGRPPLQVNSNARRTNQKPPAWPEPPGAPAARLLAALLNRRRP